LQLETSVKMTPLNESLYRQGKYICVHCRKFKGVGCNTRQARYVKTDCTRVNFGSESMCKCDHNGGYIDQREERVT